MDRSKVHDTVIDFLSCHFPNYLVNGDELVEGLTLLMLWFAREAQELERQRAALILDATVERAVSFSLGKMLERVRTPSVS